MEVVATLLVIAALVVVWFLIARLMKRKNVNFIFRHLLGAVAGSVAMVVAAAVFIAAGLIDSSQESQPESIAAAVENSNAETAPALADAPAETTQESAAPDPEEKPDLGLTAEQFAVNFNKALKPMDLPFKAPDKPTVKSGDVKDSFTFMLDDYIGIMGSVNKHNGMVNSVMMTGTGDGTQASGARVMLSSVAMFMAASNDVSESGKKAASETLMQLFDKQKSSDDKAAKTHRSGLLFMIASPEGLGTWFTVSREK